jgi:hypothetical protein
VNGVKKGVPYGSIVSFNVSSGFSDISQKSNVLFPRRGNHFNPIFVVFFFFHQISHETIFSSPPVLREVRFIFGILLVTFPLVDYYTIGGALIVERKNGRNFLQVS